MELEIILDTAHLHQQQSEQLQRELAVLNYLVYHQQEVPQVLHLAQLSLFAFSHCQRAFEQLCALYEERGQVDYWTYYTRLAGSPDTGESSHEVEMLYVNGEDFPFSEERTRTRQFQAALDKVVEAYRLRQLKELATAIRKMMATGYDALHVRQRIGELLEEYDQHLLILNAPRT